MVDFHIVIPARYNSSRFPGKPLALINDKMMLQRVWEIALSTDAKTVTIATDSTRIKKAAEDFGAVVVLTQDICESGTDRLAKVAEHMGWEDNEIVVNLQGDEPLMPLSLLNQAAQELEYFDGCECDIATLFTFSNNFDNINDVKVVTDEYGIAMYFSRQDIPHGATTLKRHVGIYAYRVRFLRSYGEMPQCGLEKGERLEQLRAMYHGAKIRVEEALEVPGPDVNCPEDIKRVEKALNERRTTI